MPASDCLGCAHFLHHEVRHCPYCGYRKDDGAAPVKKVVRNKKTYAPITSTQDEVTAYASVSSARVAIIAAIPVELLQASQQAGESLPRAIPQVVTEASTDVSPPKQHGIVVGVAAVFVVVLALYLFGGRDERQVACSVALLSSGEQLALGDAAAARAKAITARVSCNGADLTKADSLRDLAEVALASKAQCEQVAELVAARIADHRLRSATEVLEAAPAACIGTEGIKALRSRLAGVMAEAAMIEETVRGRLDEGDTTGATKALDTLAAADRDRANLDVLRTRLRTAVDAAVEPINAVVPVREAALVPAQAMPAPTIPPPMVIPTGTARPQAELVPTMLSDAEQALALQKFDVARTFAESVRKIDPANEQASALLARIKEREFQYLKEETTIR